MMERLQSSLFEAAAKGCVNSLQQLLISDPLILHRSFINRFNETPLHVSAMLGHIDFVKQTIEINPQLVCELNLQKHSPLHLAAARGHVEVVAALLSVDDRVTCLACDRNGLTPVHLAAMKGRDEAVKLLLVAQPDAARMLAYEEETILHLCVKNYQLEALKLILTTLNETEFLNSKDVHGNTVLHLAVADKQVETTKFLLSMARVEVNAQNEEGLTAMDVLIRSRRDVRDSAIEESLKHTGSVVASLETTTIATNNNNNDNNNNTSSTRVDQQVMKTRSTDGLMVVAILVVTMIFQIAANPPGGVWQDDNFLIDSKGKYVDPQGRRVSKPVDSQNNTVRYPHQAGHSVLARNDPEAYNSFYVFNTIGFFTTLGIIFFLSTGLQLSNGLFNLIFYMIIFFAFTAVAISYSSAVKAVTPKIVGTQLGHFTDFLSLVCFLLIAALFVFYTFLLRWPVTGRIQGAEASSALPAVV